jgi:hypothetical protein
MGLLAAVAVVHGAWGWEVHAFGITGWGDTRDDAFLDWAHTYELAQANARLGSIV